MLNVPSVEKAPRIIHRQKAEQLKNGTGEQTMGNLNAEAIKRALEEMNMTGVSPVAIRKAVALIKELTEENERLRKHNAVLIEDNHILSSECIPMAKADTVRKMQERLEKCLSDNPSLFTQQRYIVVDVIDQIAKEMLEGENGTTIC
jgi:hypothetical protein